MSRIKHLSEIVEAKQSRPNASSAKSQGLVEFALILPILLLTIFVILEVARVLHAWLAIENGARFGVRYAVTQEYDTAYCSAFVNDKCEDQTEEPFAQLQSIKDAARAGAVAILRNQSSISSEPGYFKVNVCSSEKYIHPDSANPFGYCDPDEDPGEPGEFVSVTVDFNHPLITPMLTAVWPQLKLTARREAIVEEFRTSRVVNPPEGLPTLKPTNTYTVSPTFTSTITPTPTLTPTVTHTPTPTPTPSCSGLSITRIRIRGDDVEVDVRNDNHATAYLINSYLEWEELSSDMEVDHFKFNGQQYYNGNDNSSPTSSFAPSIPLLGDGNSDRWAADFRNEPFEPIWGTYFVELTFDFPDGPTCVVSASLTAPQLPSPTPKPTKIPPPTKTPGPSPTPKPTKIPAPTNTPGPPPTPKPTKVPPPTDTPGPPPTPISTKDIPPPGD